jgi:hypothetical protein
MRSNLSFVVCALMSWSLVDCEPKPQGSDLGTFAVQGTRSTNTCGAQSMELAPSIAYNVTLQITDTTIQWRPSGGSSAMGTYDKATGAFRVTLEEDIVAWRSDPRRSIVGCTLRRSDILEGAITYDGTDGGTSNNDGGQDAGTGADAGASARSFRATENVVFGPSPGSDCRPLIGAATGQFNTMPCEISYALTAQRQPSPNP